MFGLIRSGGGVDKYFKDTRLNDVIFQSSSEKNNIVIGNFNSNSMHAAVYISHNSLGVNKLPSHYFSLDVCGYSKFDNNVIIARNEQQTLELSPEYIKFESSRKRNMMLHNIGILENKLVITNDIQSKKHVLQGVCLQNVIFEQGYLLLDVSLHYEAYFKQEYLIRAKNTLFKIDKIEFHGSESLRLFIINYFLDEINLSTTNFSSNECIDIEVFKEYTYDEGLDELVSIPLKIHEYFFMQLKYLYLRVEVIECKNINFFQRKKLFHFKQSKHLSLSNTIDNVLMLEDFYYINDSFMYVVFKSLDNKSDISIQCQDILNNHALPIQLYLYILESFNPLEPITESSVSWGLYISNVGKKYLGLKGTKLASIANHESFSTNTVEYMSFNNNIEYEVDSCVVHPTEGLLVSFLDTTLDSVHIERGFIAYNLIGTPLRIIEANFINEFTVRYTIQNSTNILASFNGFKNHFVYIIDKETRIWKIVTVTSQYMDLESLYKHHIFTSSYMFSSRTIYVHPFKFLALNVIGDYDSSCYVHNALGIGTNLLTEKLTVAGNASINNELRWYDHKSDHCFFMNLQNNTFNINNVVHICDSNITCSRSLQVKGVITANDFMSVSDKYLKKNIVRSDPLNDLELIRKLYVHNFEFIDINSKGIKKGVMAQDIEKLVPDIVSNSQGIIPSIYTVGFIEDQCKIVLRNLKTQPEGICPGTSLRIYVNKEPLDVVVKMVVYKVKKMTIYTVTPMSSKIVKSTVFVYGQHGTYKTVDKDFLFMTALNALKALDIQIQDLKKTLEN